MAILWHANFSLTREISSQASPKTTREALRRLGESLDQRAVAALRLYKIRNGHPEDSEPPLNCVGTAGFEPRPLDPPDASQLVHALG